MNLKQMTAFRELMLTGSVSEAARNLNRTQPSISHMIATLEDDLGMKLFVRRNGRLHPVPEALYLLEECKYLLHRVDTVSQNMSRMKAMESGELRVACMPGPAAFLMPNLICRQVGTQQDVKATILSRSTEAVFQLISSQQFDLGLADYDPHGSSEASLLSTEIFGFECKCAIPSDDPLAKKTVVTPADLEDRPMASLFTDHPIFKLTQRAFALAGCRLNLRFETSLFIQLLAFVQQGLACAIVDPLTVEASDLYGGGSNGVTFRPFSPAVEFGVVKLTPGYRPVSLLARSFSEKVTAEFLRLGAKVIDPEQSSAIES